HGGTPLQYFGQYAGMTGIKMRHQHKGHADISRDIAEELFKGLKSAGRCSHSNNREVSGLFITHFGAGIRSLVFYDDFLGSIILFISQACLLNTSPDAPCISVT